MFSVWCWWPPASLWSPGPTRVSGPHALALERGRSGERLDAAVLGSVSGSADHGRAVADFSHPAADLAARLRDGAVPARVGRLQGHDARRHALYRRPRPACRAAWRRAFADRAARLARHSPRRDGKSARQGHAQLLRWHPHAVDAGERGGLASDAPARGKDFRRGGPARRGGASSRRLRLARLPGDRPGRARADRATPTSSTNVSKDSRRVRRASAAI